jgi:hypothetical protein
VSRTPTALPDLVNSLFGLGMGAFPLLFWLERRGYILCNARQALAPQLFSYENIF